MHTVTARSRGPAETAWRLYARPAEWPTWVPYLRGAWGLGDPEVEPGRSGAARLLGVLPVPARVVAKRPGRSWTWQVPGGITFVHRVEPVPSGGCVVAVDLFAPPGVEQVLAATYGPVMGLAMRSLARAAERA